MFACKLAKNIAPLIFAYVFFGNVSHKISYSNQIVWFHCQMFPSFDEKTTMKTLFIIGDIVQKEAFITSIISIDGRIVRLADNRVCDIAEIAPVKICNQIGYKLSLLCDNPVRASILRLDQEPPKRYWSLSFLNCYVDGFLIRSIVHNQNLCYIHQLQAWLNHNAPDYHLIVRRHKVY